MQRAMARQAEAERERRAKIIGAQGEFEAAEQLSMAADRIAASPIALQLRYLQTLLEISSSNNATTILPIPIDILRPLQEVAKALTPPPRHRPRRRPPRGLRRRGLEPSLKLRPERQCSGREATPRAPRRPRRRPLRPRPRCRP